MKRIYQWVLAATLTCGLMTLTSCQGLVDAVFGEDAQPAESSKPSTDPEKPTTFDAKTTPLTLEALVANTIVKIDLMDGLELTSVEYSTDGTTWTALSSDPQEIKLAAVGDKVMLRGANGSYATDKDATRITCSSDGAATRGATRSLENKAKCIVYGNTRSMLKKEGFSTINDLTDPYTFKQLFLEAGIDIDQAKALLLPDGKMSEGCFMEMFKGNTDMTNTPVLGAKTMVPKCFQEIFAGCSNVSEVVMLATEVAAGATVKDCAENWLKDTGTKCDVPPVLFVSAEPNFSFEDLLEDTGDNWVVVDAETEEIIPTGIEIKWGEEGEVLDIDEETEIGMTVGDEEALTATLLPKEAEGEVELSVSDDEILSIENGKVKALKAGTATIKATYTNGDKEISVSFKVVVSAAEVKVTSITLTNTTAEVEVGSTVTLSVKAVAPDDATDPTYTWKSSDETKATVDKDGNVTGVAAGIVTIYAEANDGSGVKGECAVTVKAAKGVNAITPFGAGGNPLDD